MLPRVIGEKWVMRPLDMTPHWLRGGFIPHKAQAGLKSLKLRVPDHRAAGAVLVASPGTGS